MENITIALVDTPGLFASLIRMKVKIPYVHVVLALDEQLCEAYTFGRRDPRVPLLSGFAKEEPEAVLAAFPEARYKILRVACTGEQKDWLRREMQSYYENRRRYHYCLLGLPFVLAGRPFYQPRRYTCTSFIAQKLGEAGILDFGKHFSLVTPLDFYEADLGTTIYEGPLWDYLRSAPTANRSVRAA